MPLNRVIFTSTAKSGFTDDDLTDIVYRSQLNNEATGFTGMLLCGAGMFVQILEGEKKEIQYLMAKIAKDPRHHDIEILTECEIQTRVFKKWVSTQIKDPNTSSDLMSGVFVDHQLFNDNIDASMIDEQSTSKMIKACLNLTRH